MEKLTTTEELDQAISRSDKEPVFLFKHSTTCPISSGAHQAVEKFEQSDEACPPIYMVRVIEERPVSNEIAQRFDVQHKSPQMLLVKNGSCIWTASHHGINQDKLKEACQKAAE
jgi:bacillithiol system protein YtxJ